MIDDKDTLRTFARSSLSFKIWQNEQIIPDPVDSAGSGVVVMLVVVVQAASVGQKPI